MAREPGPSSVPDVSRLGASVPRGPVLLDANVFINALAGRGPAVLRVLLEEAHRLYVAAPTRAELAWVRRRLDPAHPSEIAERFARHRPRAGRIRSGAGPRGSGHVNAT